MKANNKPGQTSSQIDMKAPYTIPTAELDKQLTEIFGSNFTKRTLIPADERGVYKEYMMSFAATFFKSNPVSVPSQQQLSNLTDVQFALIEKKFQNK